MPKRGAKGTRGNADKYKKMLDNTPQLCKSQVYNALYDKLRKDARLDRFIAVVQYCSMSGLDIEDTVETLVKAFPSYISEKDLTVECFKDMIKNYHDISVAWGYGSLGDIISDIIVKNKALKIVENTTNMDDIVKYNEIYGKKEDMSSEDKKTTVNFNLFKK
jgi:hypothetical protein